MDWFDFILQEGSAELAQRRELKRMEAEANLKRLSAADMATGALGFNGGVPQWVFPAVVGVGAVLVLLVMKK